MAANRRPMPLAERSYVDSRAVPVNELNEDAFTLDHFQPYTILVDSRNRDTSIFPSASKYQVRLPRALTQVRDVKLISYQFPVPKSDTGLSRTQRTIPIVARPAFVTSSTEFIQEAAYTILPDITYSIATLKTELQKSLSNFVTLVTVPNNANGLELNIAGQSSIALLQPVGQSGMLVPDIASRNRLKQGNIMYHFSIAATPDLSIMVVSPLSRTNSSHLISSSTPGVTLTYVNAGVQSVEGDDLRLKLSTSVQISYPFVGLDFVIPFAAGRSTMNRADSLAAGLLGFRDSNVIMSIGHQARFLPFESEVPASLTNYQTAGVFQSTMEYFRLFTEAITAASGTIIENNHTAMQTSDNRLLVKADAMRQAALSTTVNPKTSILFPNQIIQPVTTAYTSTNCIIHDWWLKYVSYVPGYHQLTNTASNQRSTEPFIRNNTLLVPPPDTNGRPGTVYDYPISSPSTALAGFESVLNTTGVNTTIYVSHYASTYTSRVVVDASDPLVAYKVFWQIYPWTLGKDQLGKLVAVRLSPTELASVRSSDRVVTTIIKPRSQPASLYTEVGPAHLNRLRQLLLTSMNDQFILLPRNAADSYNLIHMFPIDTTSGPFMNVKDDNQVVTQYAHEVFSFFDYVPIVVIENIVGHRTLGIDVGVPAIVDIDQNVLQRAVLMPPPPAVQTTVSTSVSDNLIAGKNVTERSGNNTRVFNIQPDACIQVKELYDRLVDIFETRDVYDSDLQYTPQTGTIHDAPVSLPTNAALFFSALGNADGTFVTEDIGTYSNVLDIQRITASSTLKDSLELELVDYYATYAHDLLTLLLETAASDSTVAAVVEGTRQAFKTGVDVPYFLVRIAGMDNIEIARPLTNSSDTREDSVYMDSVFAQIRIDDTSADLIVNTSSFAESQYKFKPAVAKLDKLAITVVRPNGALMDFNESDHNFILEFHAQSR